jgi:hypothetical protein
MSMVEERKDAACSAIQHCERMFAETQNPYYVVMALGAADWGDFKPPKWALEQLLKAVHLATFKHDVNGERISIDQALGLTVSRGKTPKEREAHKHNVEASAFDLVRVIHTCFDVSIPAACEIAYYAIDFDFARQCEENLWRPYNPPSLPAGMTRAQWKETDARSRKDSEQMIDRPEYPNIVKDKMRGGRWWTISRGDRLNYSLDQFIDRYYRVGTKHKRDFGKLSGKEAQFFRGYFLLRTPATCSYEVTLADVNVGYRPRAISAVAKLLKRPDFAQFEALLNERATAVLKSGISTQ